jgi:hypothetical protein
MLLPWFAIQILHPKQWKEYWNNTRIIYILIVSILVISQLAMAYHAAVIKQQRIENCDRIITEYRANRHGHTHYHPPLCDTNEYSR